MSHWQLGPRNVRLVRKVTDLPGFADVALYNDKQKLKVNEWEPAQHKLVAGELQQQQMTLTRAEAHQNDSLKKTHSHRWSDDIAIKLYC